MAGTQQHAQAMADMCGLNVSGCDKPNVARVMRGTYAATLQKHHGKTIYRRTEQVDHLDVLVYFWQGQSSTGDIAETGWWFGARAGCNQVWAFSPCGSDRPPKCGWKVPFSGPVDGTMTVCPATDVAPNSDFKLPGLSRPDPSDVFAIESSEEGSEGGDDDEEKEVHDFPVQASPSDEQTATADPYGGVLAHEQPAASVAADTLQVEALQLEIKEFEAQLAAKQRAAVDRLVAVRQGLLSSQLSVPQGQRIRVPIRIHRGLPEKKKGPIWQLRGF